MTDFTEGPVIVVGLFGTASGIGQSAIVCARGLREQGVAVSTIDLSAHFDQQEIPWPAELERLPEARKGTVIIHVNPPEFERALFLIKCYRRRGWRVIAYWVWELPAVPEAWVRLAKYVSEIWTPSAFVTAAFEQLFHCPVKTVPHAVFPPTDLPPQASLIAAEEIAFLVCADGRSSLFRKGLVQAIKAFQSAFPNGEPHRLTVKCRNLDTGKGLAQKVRQLVAKDDRIDLIDASLNERDKWRLIARHDAVISMHRSEGYGLVLAEAMALGKTVVATGWSGNMTFMTAKNSLPLPYAIERVDDPTHIYANNLETQWAAPDMSAAIIGLRQVASDPNWRRTLGREAMHTVANFRGGAYVQALGDCKVLE